VLAGLASGSGLLARALSYQRDDQHRVSAPNSFGSTVAVKPTVVDEPTVAAGHLNDATAADADAAMVDAPIMCTHTPTKFKFSTTNRQQVPPT
jgi:hypothetical protein